MKDTTITLHTQFQIGQVDERIFGGFLEHMGRAVYEGVYDPKSAHADEDGFRTDVLTALKRLQYTVMRYPGGNFVSGYHWLDGVGPREQRPTVRELAWQSIEPAPAIHLLSLGDVHQTANWTLASTHRRRPDLRGQNQ